MARIHLLLWPMVAACGSLSYYGPQGADGPVPPDTGGFGTLPTQDTSAPPEPTTDPTTDPTTGDDDDDSTTPTEPPPGVENCLAAGDEDSDGLSDCDDPDCDPVCDGDRDGVLSEAVGGSDCDDSDPDVNPTVFDHCNGVDDDCSGRDDDGDFDRDGTTVCNDCDDGDASRHPGANDVCDGVDSDCDQADCPPGASFSDGFESGAISGSYTFGGSLPWTITTDVVRTGTYGARSGNITDSQMSQMELTLDFSAAGTISFWHRGVTESGYDFFSFYIDGAFQDNWSGTWGWDYASYPVSSGRHTFRWQYRKDASVSQGTDRAAIDDIEATNAQLP